MTMATLTPPPVWQPTPDEVRRIVDEMRPIIHEFARRARLDQIDSIEQTRSN